MSPAKKQVNSSKAKAHEEVVIAKDNRPLANRVPIRAATGKRRPGSGKGEILWMSPDFDETPEAFNDYVP